MAERVSLEGLATPAERAMAERAAQGLPAVPQPSPAALARLREICSRPVKKVAS